MEIVQSVFEIKLFHCAQNFVNSNVLEEELFIKSNLVDFSSLHCYRNNVKQMASLNSRICFDLCSLSIRL